ncbi:MAG: DUF1573 domain-containing protein [Bacteroidia bacterium]|nr:DUF1573 domain-containing protein [Bacteroidia bacterium]
MKHLLFSSLTIVFLLTSVKFYSQPVINVSQPSFTANLSCDDLLSDILTISNTGTGDLNFYIESCGGIPPLSQILSKLNQNYTAITALVPNMYSFTDGITGNNINDGGNDMYDGANYLNTSLETQLSYSDNLIITSAAMGSGGQYFTRKNTGLFVFAADINNIDYFEITGNNGADGSGNVDASVLTAQFCGATFKGFVKRVYNATDPSINHLIIVEDKPGIAQTYSTNTNDDQHRITGLNSSTRIYYLLYASTSGGYITDATTLNIMNEFLQSVVMGEAASWLTYSPDSGLVSSGNSENIQLDFNSTGLVTGQNITQIFIISNDSLTPVIAVPCTLNVTGTAQIELSDICLSLDSVMQWTTSNNFLQIYNTGCDTLFITNMTTSLSEFNTDVNALTILSGDSALVTISFTPTALGNYYDTLIIYNNDADTSICLTGFALSAPNISFSPDSLNVTIAGCCDSTTLPLTIYNTGESDLFIEISNIQNIPDSLSTLFAGGNGQDGNMFNITALNTITITQFAGNLDGINGYMKIYYRTGTYQGYETNSLAWTFIDSAFVTSNGIGTPTIIPVSIDVTIPAGQTYGFYVTGNNSGLDVDYTDGSSEGAVYVSDLNIQLHEGKGVEYPFGNNFTPRIWNGTIYYESGYGYTDWLSFNTIYDSITSGDSTIIDVTFISCGLNSGIYTSDISINSNTDNFKYRLRHTGYYKYHIFNRQLLNEYNFNDNTSIRL